MFAWKKISDLSSKSLVICIAGFSPFAQVMLKLRMTKLLIIFRYELAVNIVIKRNR